MKNLFLILLAIIAGSAHAQNLETSVMIIPFSPDMYFSDADNQLAKYNDKNVKEVRNLFRYGVNINLNARIVSEYATRQMLADTAGRAADDLYKIYNTISYFEDKPIVPEDEIAEKTETGKGIEKIGDKLKNLFKNSDRDAQTHTDATNEVNAKRYMNVRINNSKMLPFLHQQYGTELFLFINQFNLVTNYEHCLDRATNTFEREFIVHYSLFDYTGKQLAGNVATVYFPSNANDMSLLMKTNFPPLADIIANSFPHHVKVKESKVAGMVVE